MKHTLIELLQNYFPEAPEEQICKKQMLDFAQKYPNCFERLLVNGHFTGSAWLLNQDKSQVLFLHHAKLDKWLQLGGHCDGNPDVLAVAIKEAQEESGINHIVSVMDDIFDIDIHVFPATSKNQEHYHYDVRFLLKVVGDESIIQNHESKELRWFGKNRDKLPNQDLSIMRMFDKWQGLR